MNPEENPSTAQTFTEQVEAQAHRLYNEPLLTAQERKTERKRAYVELMASGCNHQEASEGVGVDRATAFRWRQEDPAFAQACREALRASVDVLKAEAERRALKGSDKLLMFLLERYDPEKFHLAQKLEHSGAVDLAGAVLAARRRAQGQGGQPAEDNEPGSDLC